MKDTNTACDFNITDFNKTKEQMLNWVNRFSIFCFLDNHQYQIEPHSLECMLAAGARRQFLSEAGNAFENFQTFIEEKKGWLFGHLGYDLKNEIETLTSSHPDYIKFPDIFFFEPEIIIRLTERKIHIEGSDNAGKIYQEIQNMPLPGSQAPANRKLSIQERISKKEYIDIINKLRYHILRGDCYEINFCQDFFAENVEIDPLVIYNKLSTVSPNPFSALYKLNEKYLVCASPERYLKKQGNKILSQPIKGTSSRFLPDRDRDEISKEELHRSEKDRSENVMVVDLVRNDLSRICKEGKVSVDGLYGIYSFPQVHQMISTVSGELRDEITFTEIIKSTFPMGSMTGAPKKRVMELIEQYEKTKRGIFSGALGYIDPAGDFDFNVVIRSILYNAGRNYLSFPAGSGITFYSDAIKEYEECLLKAEAIRKVLSRGNVQKE